MYQNAQNDKVKLQNDLNEIARNGFKAKIQTDEGKIHYMLYCLEQYILNGEMGKVKFLYDYFNKPENKLSFDKLLLTILSLEKITEKKYNLDAETYSIFIKVLNKNPNYFIELEKSVIDLVKNDKIDINDTNILVVLIQHLHEILYKSKVDFEKVSSLFKISTKANRSLIF